MKCPSCGLTNPPIAQICDCGYHFEETPSSAATTQAPSRTHDFSGRLYWFDLNRLELDLARAQFFSSRSIFKYLLAECVVFSVCSGVRTFTQRASDFDVVTLVSVLIAIAVDCWGLWYVYDSNGGHSGKDFLPRLLTLGWVWGWRFAFLVVIPFWLIAAILNLYFEVSASALAVLWLGVWSYYYIELGNRMKQVCRGHEEFFRDGGYGNP